MRIFTHLLESTVSEQTDTEIRFVIASARALDKELINFKIKNEAEDNLKLIFIKHLKAVKKQGKIDFFATKEDFAEHKAEASYLINKFPEVSDIISTGDFGFIVKL